MEIMNSNQKHGITVFFKISRCLQRFQQAGVYGFAILQVFFFSINYQASNFGYQASAIRIQFNIIKF